MILLFTTGALSLRSMVAIKLPRFYKGIWAASMTFASTNIKDRHDSITEPEVFWERIAMGKV